MNNNLPKTVSLPKKLSYSRLLKNQTSTYTFVEYIDKSGKTYIAKLFLKRNGSKQYNQLKNEASVYKLLNSFILSNKSVISKKFPEVHIPDFVGTFENDNIYAIFISKFAGKDIASLPLSKKLKIYKQVIKYFEFLNFIGLTNTEDVATFNKFKFYAIIFVTLAVAAFKDLEIIKLVNYKELLSILWSHNPNTFIHRDLDDTNILYRGNKIAIIDFQLSVFTTIPLLELGNIYFYLWNQNSSNSLMQFFSTLCRTKKQLGEFNAAAFFSILFDQSFGGEKSKQVAKSYMKSLS